MKTKFFLGTLQSVAEVEYWLSCEASWKAQLIFKLFRTFVILGIFAARWMCLDALESVLDIFFVN